METCDTIADCVTTTPPPCNDGVDCTVDICDESTDSCSITASDALCGDGKFCDGVEICDASMGCLPGSAPCNDHVGCTVDICNEAQDTCSNLPDDLACLDGLACNGIESCDDVAGCLTTGPLVCDDGVACTVDACDAALDVCTSTPDNTLCIDSNACNGMETCEAASGCTAGTPPTCDDGQFCNGIESCDAALGCQSGAAPDCSDGTACTLDGCDEIGDTCTNTPSDPVCDNGQFCDGAETCDATLGCQPGIALICDDSVPCTDDLCDEGADACVNTPVDAACEDGNVCNGMETCDAVANCMAGAALVCEDAGGCIATSCDPVAGCGGTPVVDGTSCEDGNLCTTGDSCAGGACTSGPPAICNDGNVCTTDSCTPATGCTTAAVADGTTCADANVCDGAETCQGGNCAASTALACNNGQFC
ncbi:MAG: hypothetical protein E4H03_01410, partial [Myxococcales bacterium]